MTESQALGDTFCVSGEASSACWVEYTQGMLECRREGESKHVYARFAECVAVNGDFTHWHPIRSFNSGSTPEILSYSILMSKVLHRH